MFLKKSDESMNLKPRHQRDSENRVIIDMTVKDDSDFLSVFSRSDTPVISTEVADFIENSTDTVLPREQLTLRIHSNCIDDNEKELYKKSIRQYYSEKSISNMRELKRNNIIVFLLTVAGVIVLASALLLEQTTGSLIWSEVIDIAAWVFLWEAVDISAFGNRSLRLKKKRYLSYLSMKVEYFDLADRQRES